MDIKVFLEELNNAEVKQEYVNTHIVRNYVPYAEKMAGCRRIIEASMYTEINKKKVFQINTPARLALFLMICVDMYTDITYPPEAVFDCFDLLIKNGVAGLLTEGIGADYAEFRAYLDMATADRMEMECGLTSWLERKIEALNLSVDSIMEAMVKVAGNNGEETK